MKQSNVILAGFGGQGVLLAGKILAYAAMDDQLEVSWLPSYGPEMRGGTANVTVCISERMIGSPLVTRPKSLIAMNRPSLDKFGPKVTPGGLILINQSLVDADIDRQDCTIVKIDSLKLARDVGSEKAATMIMLGAWMGLTRMVSTSAMQQALEDHFHGERASWLDVNLRAFASGMLVGRDYHHMAVA